MGKKRKSTGNVGNYPTMSEDVTGTIFDNQSVQPTRDDKVKEALNQLYGDIYEEEIERDALYADYADRQRKIDELEKELEMVEQSPNRTQIRVDDLNAQIREQELLHERIGKQYRKQQKKVDEMNERIVELETGFSNTGARIDYNEPGRYDHGL